jgi:protein TonB
MQDAVADVLVQRRRLEGGSQLSVIASLLLHGGLIATVVIAAMRSPSTPPQRVIQMRLAQSSRSAPAGGATQAVRSTPKPVQQPKPKPPQPDVTPKADPAPVPKPPKRTSRGEALFGQSDLPAPKATKTPPASSAPPSSLPGSGVGTAPGTGIGAVPGIGKAGVTGLEGGDFPYPTYIDRMISLVGTKWYRPPVKGEALVQVYFVIERNGKVRDWKVEKSSGNPTFDRAALRSVIESSPLPPLPLGYNGTELGVHLTFH